MDFDLHINEIKTSKFGFKITIIDESACASNKKFERGDQKFIP